MKPLVSVIIPAYNRSNSIARAIESVQFQTYAKWEVIVIDDGSSDNTSKIVQGMAEKDSRIRLIRHSTNRGAQAARNTGIKSARGAWISFLDSDDEWLPHSLQVRLDKANECGASVVHSGGYIIMDGQGLEPYRVSQPSGRVYSALLANENPMFPTLLVKKEAFERIGYLDEKVVSFQEWDTCIRLARYFNFGFVPEPTFIYDFRTQNAISKNNLRVAVGYKYVVSKHFFNILAFAGPKALSNHYAIISDWYEKAGNYRAARLFKLRKMFWAAL
jgi:glycosyltransferase involved in cell wall biosynthesis